MALFDETLALDSIALTDSLLIAAAKVVNFMDTVAITEQLLVETTFNVDAIDISDQALAHKTIGVVVADSAAMSDVATPGFVLWRTLSDSVLSTDDFEREIDYNRVLGDTIGTTDVPHTWMAEDAILEAELQGTADLRAVMMTKKAPGMPAGMPPRKIQLPKPPTVRDEHVVVDPNPTRRGER